MKKIAIFQDDLDYGGIQKSLINLLNLIDYDKYKVDLFLFKKESRWVDRVNKNVTIRYLEPMKRVFKYLPFEFAFGKSKYDFSDVEEYYDLAIDYNSYQPWTAIAAISIPANNRVMWVHNDISLKYNEEWKYRILFNSMKGKYQFFEKYAFVSDALVDSFKRLTKIVDREYYVIPNTIDTDEIFEKSKEELDSISMDDDRINICAVGRLCHQKGYDIMIDNFFDAYRTNQNLRLFIIGNGPDYNKITNKIQNKQLNDVVILLGGQDNPYSIMNLCDAFISTSRYEGQGMNIMEAKVLGLQIIIPKHLEKYVEEINGVDNVVEALINLHKEKKIRNNLDAYNKKILEMIDTLC